MSERRSVFWLFSAIFCFTGLLGLAGSLQAQNQIDKLEINQAIGVQKDNHLHFVAGKSTVVRAILAEPVTLSKRKQLLNQTETKAVVKRNGQVVATLAPKSTDQPTKIIDFLCTNMSACGNWAAGNYEFEVTVKGVTKSTAGTDYQFKERQTPRVLAVPVKARYKDTITTIPADNKWRTSWEFMRDVYPVEDKGILWTVGGEVDASDKMYDLESKDGQWELWNKLRGLLPTSCAAEPKGNGCFDLIVGFISDCPDGYPNGELEGYTYGSPVNVVVAKEKAVPATVAHEIGHALGGLGDTYEGGHFRCDVNPAPDGLQGKDWDTSKKVYCTKGKEAFPSDGLGATKIPADVHSYEVNGRGALGDLACFMGSAGSQKQIWITPESFDRLFAKLKPPTTALLNLQDTQQRLVRYSGFITRTDHIVVLDPWESLLSAADMPDTTGGNFALKALDEAGTVLATKKLDVQFLVHSNPPALLSKAPFQGAMRFPAGTVKFQIVRNEDGNVLKEVPVNPIPPVVSDVTPTSPMELKGNYTIQWTATAPEGTTLFARVEYNPDVTDPKSPWQELISGLEASQWEESFDELPGGRHARIRVSVTDGVNAASAESADCTVPMKAPSVFISDLPWGYEYELGDEVLLEAEAYDLQDEWLPDDNLTWVSSLSGFLGTGSKLLVSNLPAGEHIITLTARNSAGLSASDTTELSVNSCSFAISPQKRTFNAGASSFNVAVSATGAAKCTLTDDDLVVQTADGGDWLKAKVTTFNENNGVVEVTVSANDTAFARTGSVEIVGQTFEVKQKGAPCRIGISPQMKWFSSEGGRGAISVSAPKGCEWIVNRDSGWLVVTTGDSGSGKGTIRYVVEANHSGKPRVAEITVISAGNAQQKKTFILYQEE